MNRRTTLSMLAAASALGFPGIARAADPVPLQLGTMGADGSAEPFYGSDHGFFKDAGLDVKITVMNNTASLASAVAGGALEIGYGSVIPLAQAHLRGLEFRVIAPAFEAGGPQLTNVIMVGKNSTAKTGADLNNTTVAVNGLRDLTQYEMQAWIDQNGGDVKTVKLIEIPFPEMGVAVESGRVSAAILAEPFTTQALALGQGADHRQRVAERRPSLRRDVLVRNAGLAASACRYRAPPASVDVENRQVGQREPLRYAADHSEVHEDHA